MCDCNRYVTGSGVATIDATAHLRAQTNQPTKILLHFVVRLTINLSIN